MNFLSRLMVAPRAAAAARSCGRGATTRAPGIMSFSTASTLSAAVGAVVAPVGAATARGMPTMTRGFAAAAAPGDAAAAGSGQGASQKWEAPAKREADDRGIQLDLVEKYLSEACMAQNNVNDIALAKAQKSFQRHELDCGSTEVQVARLTAKIQYMIKHLLVHKKDHAGRRGLQGMLARRRKLLKYLRRTEGDRYGDLIFRLGLRDNVVAKARSYK